MKSTLSKTIRVVGIVITALLIPISMLALFALQGLGGGHQMVEVLHIAWALANFIGIPFILLGFIIRYNIAVVVYLAVAHFALSLANMALLLTNMAKGSAILLAIVALPSALYIIGYLTQRQGENQVPKESEESQTDGAE